MEVNMARTLVGGMRGAAAVRDASATAAAVAKLGRASKEDQKVRVPLADAGMPYLASQLTFPSTSASTEDAARLLNISISAQEQLMSSPGILNALAAAMRAEEYPAAHHATATVAGILCVDAYRPIVGAKHLLFDALVALLCRTGRGTRTTKDALNVLFGVALYPLNRAAFIDLDTLLALVMTDGRTEIVEDATAVVAQVAECAESLDAFTGCPGRASSSTSWNQASGRANENAADVLLNLIMASG